MIKSSETFERWYVMICFEELQLRDSERLYPFFERFKRHICDFTVGGLMMWRGSYRTQVAIEDDTLYIRAFVNGETQFTFLGPDEIHAVARIMEHCDQTGEHFELCSITQRVLERINSYYRLNAEPQRDLFDYVYDADSMISLSGRQYNGQRNHINRFKRSFPDWTFEEISDKNLDTVIAFYTEYKSERLKAFEAAEEESSKVIEALSNFDVYHLYGGILKVGENIVGISLGETVGDMMFVHVEKALTEYNGVYPMLTNCFASHFRTPQVVYINREEDEGDLGLRTSKLSYHPLLLKEKYKVTLLEQK